MAEAHTLKISLVLCGVFISYVHAGSSSALSNTFALGQTQKIRKVPSSPNSRIPHINFRFPGKVLEVHVDGFDGDREPHPQLSIYDSKANLIKKFNWRYKGRFLWDGKDEQGAFQPPGVYIIRLKWQNNVISRQCAFIS